MRAAPAAMTRAGVRTGGWASPADTDLPVGGGAPRSGEARIVFARRTPPPGSGLHQCRLCHDDFVVPVWWEEVDDQHWHMLLRCAQCETYRDVTVGQRRRRGLRARPRARQGRDRRLAGAQRPRADAGGAAGPDRRARARPDRRGRLPHMSEVEPRGARRRLPHAAGAGGGLGPPAGDVAGRAPLLLPGPHRGPRAGARRLRDDRGRRRGEARPGAHAGGRRARARRRRAARARTRPTSARG